MPMLGKRTHPILDTSYRLLLILLFWLCNPFQNMWEQLPLHLQAMDYLGLCSMLTLLIIALALSLLFPKGQKFLFSLGITICTLSLIYLSHQYPWLQEHSPGILLYLLCCCSSLWALLQLAHAPRFSIRLIWGLLIFFSTCLGMTFFTIQRNLLDVIQAEVLIHSRNFLGPMMADFYSIIVQSAVLSLLLLFLILIPKHRYKNVYTGLSPLLPLTLLSILAVIQVPEGLIPPHQFWPTLSLVRYGIARPTITYKPLTIQPSNSSITRNIILIVDESIRGDMLNLPKKQAKILTPYLSQHPELQSNFGYAWSNSNCSIYSQMLLRSALSPEALRNQRQSPWSQLIGLWQYAKRAGYQTYYLDAQQNPGVLTNFMSAPELAWIDHKQWFSAPAVQRDQRMAKAGKKILNAPGKHFIYMVKHGVHFNYENSYPHPQGERFAPHLSFHPKAFDYSQTALQRSYSNGIRWAVDQFFRTLLTNLNLSDTIVIYTSDHGQNLLDDGHFATHCRNQHATWQEFLVPMILFTQQPQLKQRLDLQKQLLYNQSAHALLPKTLLEIMGYQQQQMPSGPSLLRNQSYSPILVLGSIFKKQLQQFQFDPQLVNIHRQNLSKQFSFLQ
jgi:glucan phosphoethanolaminetransferase (alkaline phosphatase superfamily)